VVHPVFRSSPNLDLDPGKIISLTPFIAAHRRASASL